MKSWNAKVPVIPLDHSVNQLQKAKFMLEGSQQEAETELECSSETVITCDVQDPESNFSARKEGEKAGFRPHSCPLRIKSSTLLPRVTWAWMRQVPRKRKLSGLLGELERA